MKIVKVEWLDSAGDEGRWLYKEDTEELKPVKCFSVGFKLSETKKYITLVQSCSKELIMSRITIPKFAIINMKVVK